MLRDLSLPELRQYRPAVEEPPDFDEFWASWPPRPPTVPSRYSPAYRPRSGTPMWPT
jgi:cephalosporin-C deacetylase-like acetyl esterase